jgi:indolepyruvate ferredoxin oxidoreductase
MLKTLTPATHASVCDWAEAASGIKGFGPVKARNVATTRARWREIEAGL